MERDEKHGDEHDPVADREDARKKPGCGSRNDEQHGTGNVHHRVSFRSYVRWSFRSASATRSCRSSRSEAAIRPVSP